MVEHITDNPQFIVNGFIRFGIIAAIDGMVDMGSSGIEESRTEELESGRLRILR